MKFIHNVFLIGFGLFLSFSFGQNIRIVDALTGYPVQDVFVYNEMGGDSVTSDADGVVNLSLFSKEESVTFEHISYEDAKRAVAMLTSGKQVALYPDTQKLSEIVLSATRSKDEKKRVSKQVAILTDRVIVSQAPNTSAELLSEAPGIRVQRSQGGGGSPVIRGFEANRILLVIDGVRMNNAIYRSGHLHNAISIDPYALSRAE
jgi:Outer membrane cobalamin receptor protein